MNAKAAYGLNIDNEYEWEKFVEYEKSTQEKDALEILEHRVGTHYAQDFGKLLALAWNRDEILLDKINERLQLSQTQILSFSDDIGEFENALVDDLIDRVSDED